MATTEKEGEIEGKRNEGQKEENATRPTLQTETLNISPKAQRSNFNIRSFLISSFESIIH